VFRRYVDISNVSEDAVNVQPGFYSGLSSEAYHSAEGISTSFLKTFARAPAKARYGKREETEALKLGTLIHCAVTEPEELPQRYAVTDLDRMGTKAWEEAERRAGGRVLIKRPVWDEAHRIQDAVWRHPIARELLGAPGPVEDSFWWTDPETQVLCRGRADKIATSMRVIVDLKSTENASRDAFRKTIEDYFYDWQSFRYQDGVSHTPGGFVPEAFVFLPIEKEEPYLVAAYELMPDDMERARDQVREQMLRCAECLRTDVWPGYSETLEPIELTGRVDFRLSLRSR
jgi:hypothetical protein